MRSRLLTGTILGGVAFLAGLILQCGSDPAVTGDGGLLDSLVSDLTGRDGKVVKKDGIGPKADAAPTGAKRQVFKGTMDPKTGKFSVCNSAWTDDNPPMAQLWFERYGYLEKNAGNSHTLCLKKGCYGFCSTNGFYSGKKYRLVVIF